jgi:3-oxoacyl-(acyl-carrier-protein) synthase
VKQGANAASPLLFPETVFNAPASHIAAMLGVNGATYTLVGDGTVGLQALHFGAELLALGEADHVLVVAAEELDWVLVQAHADWRLIRGRDGRGAVLAEGAAAVLLSKDAPRADVTVQQGQTFFSRSGAPAAMERALAGLASSEALDFILSGGNGTWADGILDSALQRGFPTPRRAAILPKACFGEAIGAGALLQVVLAADALCRFGGEHALVASLGWNQQAAAARLRKR